MDNAEGKTRLLLLSPHGKCDKVFYKKKYVYNLAKSAVNCVQQGFVVFWVDYWFLIHINCTAIIYLLL